MEGPGHGPRPTCGRPDPTARTATTTGPCWPCRHAGARSPCQEDYEDTERAAAFDALLAAEAPSPPDDGLPGRVPASRSRGRPAAPTGRFGLGRPARGIGRGSVRPRRGRRAGRRPGSDRTGTASGRAGQVTTSAQRLGHQALQVGVHALVVVAHHVGGRTGAPRGHGGRLGEGDHRLGVEVGEGPVDAGLVAVVVEALGRAARAVSVMVPSSWMTNASARLGRPSWEIAASRGSSPPAVAHVSCSSMQNAARYTSRRTRGVGAGLGDHGAAVGVAHQHDVAVASVVERGSRTAAASPCRSPSGPGSAP